MKAPILLLAAAALILPPAPEATAQDRGSRGQTNASEQQGQRRFWQATLPGGSYMVALDRISSLGKHEYLVDGNFLVTEVTIDTMGTVTARFYYGEPYTPSSPSSVGQVLIDRTRGTVDAITERTGASQYQQMVNKNYPLTTHAKTIEFHIASRADLDALYDSITGAWTSGRGARFTIRNE